MLDIHFMFFCVCTSSALLIWADMVKKSKWTSLPSPSSRSVLFVLPTLATQSTLTVTTWRHCLVKFSASTLQRLLLLLTSPCYQSDMRILWSDCTLKTLSKCVSCWKNSTIVCLFCEVVHSRRRRSVAGQAPMLVQTFETLSPLFVLVHALWTVVTKVVHHNQVLHCFHPLKTRWKVSADVLCVALTGFSCAKAELQRIFYFYSSIGERLNLFSIVQRQFKQFIVDIGILDTQFTLGHADMIFDELTKPQKDMIASFPSFACDANFSFLHVPCPLSVSVTLYLSWHWLVLALLLSIIFFREHNVDLLNLMF